MRKGEKSQGEKSVKEEKGVTERSEGEKGARKRSK